MLALLIHRSSKKIGYHIYKFYQKKHSRQLSGTISFTDNKNIHWQTSSSQGKIISDFNEIIDPQNGQQRPDYRQLLANQHFASHDFDIVVTKISHGGEDYNGITLLSSQALEQLSGYVNLAPNEQEHDLTLSKILLEQFPKAKHYLCFETAFHSTISNTSKMLLPAPEYAKAGIKNFGSDGLLFASLSNRLHDITDKKTAKGKWIIINLENEQTTLCAVKNNKSVYCTSSLIHHELISFNHCGLVDPMLINTLAAFSNKSPALCLGEISSFNLVKTGTVITTIEELINSNEPLAKLLSNYYIQQIIISIGKLAAILNGVHGIIFTGKAGTGNSKLRNAICSHLEFLGAEISNKANNDNKLKLHKKNSKMEIYSISASPLDGMLDQLMERI